MLNQETYEGPRSDHQLSVELTTSGNEVVVSGDLRVQAFHPEGARAIYYALLRDGQPLYQRTVQVQFEDGKLDAFVSLSHIDWPPEGHHLYEVDLLVLAPQGEPTYTGQPVFTKRIRVREL